MPPSTKTGSARSAKKRKTPLRAADTPRNLSSRATQRIISEYHTLLKRRKQLQGRNAADSTSGISQEVSDIEARIQEIGGLDGYQKASQQGQSSQRGGDTSKVLVPWLKERRTLHATKLRCVNKLAGFNEQDG